MFGFGAHRRWHYTRGEPPVRHIKWFLRSASAPKPETIMNLFRSLKAFLTRTEPPWVIEAREYEDEQRAAAAAQNDGDGDETPARDGDAARAVLILCAADAEHCDRTVGDAHGAQQDEAARSEHSSGSRSTSSSMRSVRELVRYKRSLMVFGLAVTLVTWAIFAWFIFVRARVRLAFYAAGLGGSAAPRRTAPAESVAPDTLRLALTRGPSLARQTYGMLIYRTLGEGAENEFTRSWGISYGARAAAARH